MVNTLNKIQQIIIRNTVYVIVLNFFTIINITIIIYCYFSFAAQYYTTYYYVTSLIVVWSLNVIIFSYIFHRLLRPTNMRGGGRIKRKRKKKSRKKEDYISTTLPNTYTVKS